MSIQDPAIEDNEYILEDSKLSWDDSYAIARALRALHPNTDLEQVSTGMIHQWTINLPNFDDDPNLANDGKLMAIYQEWFEEEFPV